jgi:serine/threonine protein kinase
MQQVGHNSDYPPEDAPVKPHQRFAELRSNEIDQCHLYKTIKVDIVNDEYGNDEEGTTLNDVIVPTLVLDIVMQQKNSNLHNVGQRSRSQESMECNYDDDDDDDDNDSGTQQQQQKQQCEASGYVFWLQEEKYCKDLKHGYIYTGALLKPCTRTATNRTTKNRGQKLRSKLEDEEFRLRLKHTEHRCAVKVYNIQKLENHREGSGSDSRSAAGNEIAAMQYFSTYYPIPMDLQDDIQWIQNSMYRNNIMMPLGVYRDDTNIYYIMPHADGGNLHNTLDERKGKKMTEGEARYWMNQILNGLETLQRAGICHRSISLDHLVTDKYNRLLIIDMGMGIKIPYVDGDDHKQRQRCLIKRDNAFIKEDSVQVSGRLI